MNGADLVYNVLICLEDICLLIYALKHFELCVKTNKCTSEHNKYKQNFRLNGHK